MNHKKTYLPLSPKSPRSPRHNNNTTTSVSSNTSKSRSKSPRKESGPGLRSQSRSKLIKSNATNKNSKSVLSPSKTEASKRALARRNEIRTARKVLEENKTKEIDDALAEAEAAVLEATQIAETGVQDRAYMLASERNPPNENIDVNNSDRPVEMIDSSLPSLSLMTERIEELDENNTKSTVQTHHRSDSMVTQGYVKFINSEDLDDIEDNVKNNDDGINMIEKEEAISPTDSVVSVLDQGWSRKTKIRNDLELQDEERINNKEEISHDESDCAQEESLDRVHHTPNTSPPRITTPKEPSGTLQPPPTLVINSNPSLDVSVSPAQSKEEEVINSNPSLDVSVQSKVSRSPRSIVVQPPEPPSPLAPSLSTPQSADCPMTPLASHSSITTDTEVHCAPQSSASMAVTTKSSSPTKSSRLMSWLPSSPSKSKTKKNKKLDSKDNSKQENNRKMNNEETKNEQNQNEERTIQNEQDTSIHIKEVVGKSKKSSTSSWSLMTGMMSPKKSKPQKTNENVSKNKKKQFFFNGSNDTNELENHNYEPEEAEEDVAEEDENVYRDFSMLVIDDGNLEEEYYENEYEEGNGGEEEELVEFEIEDDVAVRARVNQMDSFSVSFLRKLCLEANQLASSNHYQRACGRYELALDVHEKLHEEFNVAIDRLTDKYDEIEAKEEGDGELAEELAEAKHQLVTHITALMEDRREGLVDRAKILNNMAAVLQQTQEYEESYQTYEKALCVKKIVLGDKHFSVGHTLFNMASLLLDNQQFDDALVLLQNTLDIYKDSFGDENQATLDVLKQITEIRQMSLEKQLLPSPPSHKNNTGDDEVYDQPMKPIHKNANESFENDLTSRDRNSISLNRTTLNQRIVSGASTMTDFSIDHFAIIDKPGNEIKKKKENPQSSSSWSKNKNKNKSQSLNKDDHDSRRYYNQQKRDVKESLSRDSSNSDVASEQEDKLELS